MLVGWSAVKTFCIQICWFKKKYLISKKKHVKQYCILDNNSNAYVVTFLLTQKICFITKCRHVTDKNTDKTAKTGGRKQRADCKDDKTGREYFWRPQSLRMSGITHITCLLPFQISNLVNSMLQNSKTNLEINAKAWHNRQGKDEMFREQKRTAGWCLCEWAQTYEYPLLSKYGALLCACLLISCGLCEGSRSQRNWHRCSKSQYSSPGFIDLFRPAAGSR